MNSIEIFLLKWLRRIGRVLSKLATGQGYLGRQWATLVMLLAVLTLNIAPVAALALDAQVLPEATAAKSGFTHVLKLKYTDVTNGVIYSQWRLYPQSGNGNTGDSVDRVGVYLVSPFYVANANAGSNAVFLNVGWPIVTNQLVNNLPVGSNATQLAFLTNPPPIILSAATNFLNASLTFSNSAAPALLSAGEVHIFYRVTAFDRLRGY